MSADPTHAAAASEDRLKYKDLALHIDLDFWYALERVKLHTWKLQTPTVPLNVFLSPQFAAISGPANPDAATAATAPVNRVSIREESFQCGVEAGTAPPATVSLPVVKGELLNYNTIEELRDFSRPDALILAIDRLLVAPLLRSLGDAEGAVGAWSEASFAAAAVFTFADLKAHIFHYAAAFPVLDVGTPVHIQQRIAGGDNAVATAKKTLSGESGAVLFPSVDAVHAVHEHLDGLLRDFPERGVNPFLVQIHTSGAESAEPTPGEITFLPLTPQNIAAPNVILVVADTSAMAEYPGWPVRNLLAMIRLANPTTPLSLSMYAVRSASAGGLHRSVWFHLTASALPHDSHELWRQLVDAASTRMRNGVPRDAPAEGSSAFKVVGWIEKKGAARSVNLSSMMDPAKLAEASAQLNLSLMKWRMMPDIQLDELQRCRALVLGSGTLGCNVARNLLMWGVTNITLVDRGNVSYSNPVRQTLFEVADVVNPNEEERCKSVAAAKALRRILPTVNATGVKLTIHMPGHRIDEEHRTTAEKEILELDSLIRDHDVIFLLTDSRESRWLPTVIAAAHDKPIINAALGFDTYVVMRHGVDPGSDAASDPQCKRLGCYFCNDVVAPQDSLTARTLDQQCTVTRPGVSGIAAATAVEMLAQIYNHPLRFRCPHPQEEEEEGKDDGAREKGASPAPKVVKEGVLGIIPHQIRGSISKHYVFQLYGTQFNKCSACAPAIVEEYRKNKEQFVMKCINDPSYIEEVCGIKADKERWEKELAGWENDEDGVGADGEKDDPFAFDSSSSSEEGNEPAQEE